MTQLTAQWPIGSWGGISWNVQWHSSADFGRIGWAQCADASPASPLVYYFLAVLEFSIETMLLETAHVWNTPGKGSFLRECVVIKSLPIGHYLIMAA